MPASSLERRLALVVVMAESKRSKPKKPYPSFALTAHANGQWCKKIRGKVHFFGVWAEPDAALDRYHAVAADLHAGREPTLSVASPELIVKELGNQYLAYQMERLATGEIGGRWFEDCRRVVRHFARRSGTGREVRSLAAADFQRYPLVRAIVKKGHRGEIKKVTYADRLGAWFKLKFRC